MLGLHIYKNTDEGEFLGKLDFGDLFVSIHHEQNGAFGVFIPKNELRVDLVLEKIFLESQNYYSKLGGKLEIKIVSNRVNLNMVDQYLIKFNNFILKKVERNKSAEIIFIPSAGRLRVALEGALNEKKIKVLVVDDSKTIRTILAKIFSTDSQFEVVASAEKPSQVEDLILRHKPDVITLDIHMPEMDGVQLLKTVITPKYKIPTVMISSISMEEGPLVLDALENGAVDYVQKPEMSEIDKFTPLILDKVRMASRVKVKDQDHGQIREKFEVSKLKFNQNSLIVIGSSTGGTEALREILTKLPSEIPPILIVQHIPAVFSAAFAKRMDELCPFSVKEAKNGDEIAANSVLVAPGGKQMRVANVNGKFIVQINDDEPVNRFKPSVDYLFYSVAEIFFTHTVAVILTGMGKDGAKGMLELYKKGARTIAQDEETSVVFGMPKEAINLGGAEATVALPKIAHKMAEFSIDTKRKLKVS